MMNSRGDKFDEMTMIVTHSLGLGLVNDEPVDPEYDMCNIVFLGENEANPEIFPENSCLKWIISGALFVYFSVVIAYVIWMRKNEQTTPRSPKMIIISLFCLMIDAIGNTLIFSINKESQEMTWYESFF